MIVITTPTGQIGRQTLDAVLDHDVPVRVIARDPGRLAPRVRERVEVVTGSLTDAGVVDRALTGADAVLCLVPPNPRASSVQDHVLEFARPMSAAVGRQGVARVVGVSSLGRGVARNAGQISAIHLMDELLESTGAHYRSLCMPGFMDNLLWQVQPISEHGAFYATSSADRPGPTCATRDIAAIAAGLLLDGTWTGRRSVPVLGPEDLSQRDMARIVSEVLGRPVRYERVGAQAYKENLVRQGMSDAWAQGLVDMAAAVDAGAYDAERDAPRSATPTYFRQWCEEVLKPAVLG